MRATLAAVGVVLASACGTVPPAADYASDAPVMRVVDAARVKDAPSYDEALRRWRSAEDVNAWIGAKFEYDRARAMALSETQRNASGRVPIHTPEAFFANPGGVCVDLSRFAVETLRRIDPQARAAYLMIEFKPVTVAGNVLRRHWLAAFERDGKRYFFADSTRPGHLAGPYAGTDEFIRDYAEFRGREIVAFRELASFERRTRARAAGRGREERDSPAAAPGTSTKFP